MTAPPLPRAIALSADLRDSREAPERGVLAERLEQVLARVNAGLADEWIAPLETTRGIDEVSGVLRRRRRAFDVVAAVNVALWPQRFRFAVADGPLDVVGTRASDMDGPAFHRAADALGRAHEQGLPLALAFTHTPATDQRLAEATAALHHTILSGWTESIARTIQHLRPAGEEPRTQAAVAEQLGVTQQGVSDAQRRGHLTILTTAEEALRAWLSKEDDR